jgi:hypothetical protein
LGRDTFALPCENLPLPEPEIIVGFRIGLIGTDEEGFARTNDGAFILDDEPLIVHPEIDPKLVAFEDRPSVGV